MSDYEKDLEKTVSVLQERLQVVLDRQERLEKSTNSSLYDIKALVGQLTDCMGKMVRLDEVDYSYNIDGDKIPANYRKDKKVIEKEIYSKIDAIHDRVINLLDRFKE